MANGMRRIKEPDGETFRKLKEFACECKKALIVDRENLHQVNYPECCSDQCWPVEQIYRENPNFARSLNARGNVYAILTRESESDEWSPKYVGQRKADYLGDRMRTHLINKGEGTGSKLDDVKRAVSEGQEIAVTYIMVCPENLRHFVEETIVAEEKDRLTWNDHNPGGQ